MGTLRSVTLDDRNVGRVFVLHTLDMVAGIDVMDLALPGGKTESVAFTELGKPRAPATYTLKLSASGEDVRIPHCNGRGAVTVDGTVRDKGSKGPLVLHLGGGAVHDIRIDVTVSTYEKRIACGERVRVGAECGALERPAEPVFDRGVKIRGDRR